MQITPSLRAHWFVPAALCLVAGDLIAAFAGEWQDAALLEAAILLDLAVVLPVLYLWCYPKRGKAAFFRAAALSCLGIWAAGHIVPDQHHDLVNVFNLLRYLGLAALLAIEIKLVVALYRASFSASGSVGKILDAAKETGMPEWAAKLVAWEASLWRKVLTFLRRMIKGG